MRLLWISHFLPYPPRAGLLQRSFYLLKNLSRSAEIDLVALNQPRLLHPLMTGESEPEAAAVKELGRFCRVLSYVDVDVKTTADQWRLALRSLVAPSPYSVAWLKNEKFKRAIKSAVATSKYDVIHFDTIGLAQYLQSIEEHKGDALITLGHHNAESHMLLRRAAKEKNLLKRAYFLQEGYRLSRYERTWCPRFDLNIVCSDLDGQRLGELTGAKPMLTIENGVEVGSWPRHQVDSDPYSLIFIGTMDWYPNADAVRFFLREVWSRLAQSDSRYRFDIVGSNPPEDIRQLAAADSRIHIHGYVEDLSALLTQAGIFICPIRDGGGTKLKVLDAFAAGFPMVAHPVACEGIGVENGKHVLFASSPDEWVAQIRRLSLDRDFAHSLGRAASHHITERYSFSEISVKFSNALEGMMDEKLCAA